MEKTELRGLAEKACVEKIIKKEGVFTTEEGNSIPYKNYTIEFTIGDNPLRFKAKVDRLFNDYIEEME